ncbi:MAG: hypothetical protein Kow0099_36110 [Candidatus Abyssubacteria bacterium]
MERMSIRKLYILFCCLLLVLTCLACSTTGGGVYVGTEPEGVYVETGPDVKHGPPPHAPAWGYRAKHTYRYYPGAQVYYEPARGLYFYYEDGEWRVSGSLPVHLSVQLGEYVIIESDSDKPYLESEKHAKKYPPGQMKKKGR